MEVNCEGKGLLQERDFEQLTPTQPQDLPCEHLAPLRCQDTKALLSRRYILNSTLKPEACNGVMGMQ